MSEIASAALPYSGYNRLESKKFDVTAYEQAEDEAGAGALAASRSRLLEPRL